MGPTASGKTALAVDLVQRMSCEIISVDSALVYRDMNIGTAKPDAELLALAPHRLIDIVDPADPYSVGRFRKDALREIRAVLNNGNTPLLVGGTMLYYRGLLQGLSDLPTADATLRQRMAELMRTEGSPIMHGRLAEVDPASALRIHPNDSQRIQRALEVYETSGRSMTDLIEQNKGSFPYEVTKLAVIPPNVETRRQKIEQRFHIMLEQGLIDEVKALYNRGDLSLELPSIRAVGYRQIWQYLEGEFDHDTMVDKAIIATRQLAKRQMTWLRSESDLIVLESADLDLALKSIPTGLC